MGSQFPRGMLLNPPDCPYRRGMLLRTSLGRTLVALLILGCKARVDATGGTERDASPGSGISTSRPAPPSSLPPASAQASATAIATTTVSLSAVAVLSDGAPDAWSNASWLDGAPSAGVEFKPDRQGFPGLTVAQPKGWYRNHFTTIMHRHDSRGIVHDGVVYTPKSAALLFDSAARTPSAHVPYLVPFADGLLFGPIRWDDFLPATLGVSHRPVRAAFGRNADASWTYWKVLIPAAGEERCRWFVVALAAIATPDTRRALIAAARSFEPKD